ncbi:hypothetical protein DERP_007020 [Dermatophagoides pteronyssinus]|uniref:Uncharacterized protein n=1 Tax=Dermatophagoides pteronyssinus TaxID=6956 RepID=A0ABQ8JTX6_DERPT|nr:hypothetical protein DERP_007020 [Dermatophagoides pteronyssinus]
MSSSIGTCGNYFGSYGRMIFFLVPLELPLPNIVDDDDEYSIHVPTDRPTDEPMMAIDDCQCPNIHF